MTYDNKTYERQQRYLQSDKGKEANRKSSARYYSTEEAKEKHRVANRKYYHKTKQLKKEQQQDE